MPAPVQPLTSRLRKSAFLIFGLLCYLSVNGVLFYLIGFTGNFGVPKSIDGPLTEAHPRALFVNLGLLLLFGLQHSLMARESCKRVMSRYIPGPVQRSVYSLASVLALILLFVEWQPMPGGIWTVSHPVLRGVLYGIFGLGWSLMLLATYLIDHYELFGIRQVIVYFQGKELFPQRFKTPLLYQYVRHPLMLGFLLAFWATPDMTEGHLLFSLGMSAYILIGIHYEEKDLTRNFGRLYRQYRCLVPKLIPSLLSYRHKRQNFIRTREPD